MLKDLPWALQRAVLLPPHMLHSVLLRVLSAVHGLLVARGPRACALPKTAWRAGGGWQCPTASCKREKRKSMWVLVHSGWGLPAAAAVMAAASAALC